MTNFIDRLQNGQATPSDEFLTFFLMIAIPSFILMIIWAIKHKNK